MRDSPGTRAPRGGARDRRRRRRARRALRGHRATHPRARRAWPVRGHALHDGAAARLLPSRNTRGGRSHRRLGRARLLERGAADRTGPGEVAALHVVPRLRGAAREARRARAASRRRLPRPRRREPARRPRGRRALRRRLLRQEHAADHAAPRILGRARHPHHRGRDRGRRADALRVRLVHALHRRVPDGRAGRAGRPRLHQVPLVLDTGCSADPGGVPRAARRAGVRL